MGPHPSGGCIGIPERPSHHFHIDGDGQRPPNRQRIAWNPHMTSTEPASSPSPTGQPIVAITGASGYLGSVLVAAFHSAGFSVRRLVRTPTPDSSDRSFDLNSVGTSEILDGVDVLVHCAYDLTLTGRSDIWQTNVFGTNALLDRALSARVRRTIVLSSMSAYRGTHQLYGRAKLATEIAALSRGMCAVRPGLVYGPGLGGMAGTLHQLASLPVLPDFGPKAHQFTVRLGSEVRKHRK